MLYLIVVEHSDIDDLYCWTLQHWLMLYFVEHSKHCYILLDTLLCLLNTILLLNAPKLMLYFGEHSNIDVIYCWTLTTLMLYFVEHYNIGVIFCWTLKHCCCILLTAPTSMLYIVERLKTATLMLYFVKHYNIGVIFSWTLQNWCYILLNTKTLMSYIVEHSNIDVL